MPDALALSAGLVAGVVALVVPLRARVATDKQYQCEQTDTQPRARPGAAAHTGITTPFAHGRPISFGDNPPMLRA